MTPHPRTRRRLWTALATVTAAIVLLLAPAAAAHAETGDGSGPGSGNGSGRPGVSSVCSNDAGTADTYYLPVQRWSGATQDLHVRSNGGIVDFDPIQRQAQSAGFTVGDLAYGITTTFVQWGTQFCPLEQVGGAIDNAAGTFGEAIFDSGILTALVVVAAVGIVVAGLRGRANLGRLATKLAIVGLFGAMVVGATNSTGGGIDGTDDPYQPGTMSPGWIATTIDRTITEVAAAPAAAISNEAVVDQISTGEDQMGCSAYLAALQRGYTTSAATDGEVLPSRAVPALTVANLWQMSGYNAWSVTQFGGKNLNGQSRVACRMLDYNAAIPPSIGSWVPEGVTVPNGRTTASISDVMSRVPDNRLPLSTANTLIKPGAAAWRQQDNVVEADKAWVAWATCIPREGQFTNIDKQDGWRAPEGNGWLIADDTAREGAETVDGSRQLQVACYEFFNNEGQAVDDIFDWGDGDRELIEHAGEMPPSVYNFLTTLHGTNQTEGGAASIAYAIGAIGVFLVFGGIALSIIIVKVICLVMLFAVLFVMLLTLLPGADNDRLARYAKQYVGLSLFSAFAVFILALVTLVVKILYTLVGSMAGGPNSVMTMLLGGLLPVAAALAIHAACKVGGIPSPMTIKGAVGWGQAAAGGAATSAATAGAGRVGSLVKGFAAGQLANRGASALNSRVRGGRNADAETEQKLKPGLSESATREAKQTKKQGKSEQQLQELRGTLRDPKASAEKKRSAQRSLDQIHRQDKADTADMKKAQKTSGDAEGEKPGLRDRMGSTARRARDVGSMAMEEPGLAAMVAGEHAKNLARDVASLAKWRAGNAKDDARRWAGGIAANPKAAAGRALKAAPKVAAGAGMLVGAAAFGGLPAAAVAGGMIAKPVVRRTMQARQERIKANRFRLERDLEAFRRQRDAIARQNQRQPRPESDREGQEQVRRDLTEGRQPDQQRGPKGRPGQRRKPPPRRPLS